MQVVAELVTLVGAALVLLAGVGVARFPDLYARMHAATKASTLGIGLISIGAALAVEGATAKILLAAAFVFVTAPSAAHLVARAAYRAEGITVELTGGDDLADLVDGAGPEPDSGPGAG